MTNTPTILFAGGGTGGHIFPNLAVVDRLREMGVAFEPHFLVSDRPLDAEILGKLGLQFTALPAAPLSMHPLRLPGVLMKYRQSKAIVSRLIRQNGAVAVIGTGGFVAGPAIAAGAACGIRAALVNLDAVPGKANQMMARRATDVFSAYDTPLLPGAGVTRIGVPLRPGVLQLTEPGEARRMIGLDAGRHTLLITAGSQGARTINRMMIALVARPQVREALAGWQVFHQSGKQDIDELRAAYDAAGVPARVEAFCDAMGLAWSAADLSISRCGAGSAAEVWARAVPTLFFPYPFHKDQHQRLNAEPIVAAGGALLLTDRVEPEPNADATTPPLIELLQDSARRTTMREALRRSAPPDGAKVLAAWCAALLR